MTTMGQMQRSKFHQRDQKSCLLRTYSIFQAIDIVVMLDCLLSKTNSIFFSFIRKFYNIYLRKSTTDGSFTV